MRTHTKYYVDTRVKGAYDGFTGPTMAPTTHEIPMTDTTTTTPATVHTITDAYMEVPAWAYDAMGTGRPDVDDALDALAEVLREEMADDGGLAHGVQSSERIEAAELACGAAFGTLTTMRDNAPVRAASRREMVESYIESSATEGTGAIRTDAYGICYVDSAPEEALRATDEWKSVRDAGRDGADFDADAYREKRKLTGADDWRGFSDEPDGDDWRLMAGFENATVQAAFMEGYAERAREILVGVAVAL